METNRLVLSHRLHAALLVCHPDDGAGPGIDFCVAPRRRYGQRPDGLGCRSGVGFRRSVAEHDVVDVVAALDVAPLLDTALVTAA